MYSTAVRSTHFYYRRDRSAGVPWALPGAPHDRQQHGTEIDRWLTHILPPTPHPPDTCVQSSGFGVKGSVGRCYPIWSAFEKCLATKDHFKECMDFRDDYVECLHHRKEVRAFESSQRDTCLCIHTHTLNDKSLTDKRCSPLMIWYSTRACRRSRRSGPARRRGRRRTGTGTAAGIDDFGLIY